MLWNLAAFGTVGWASAEWAARVPESVHVGFFFATAALSAALLFFCREVFQKLDKILESAEKFEQLRMARPYRYVESLRRRLTLWLCAALVALVICATVAYVLREGKVSDVHQFVVAGYVAATAVFLGGVRMITGYLSLADFRLQLLRLMEKEQRQADELRALRPSEVLPDVSTAPTMKIVARG